MRILLVGRGAWGQNIERELAAFDVEVKVCTHDWAEHLYWADRVIIATPAITHFHLAMACIDARRPFLVEKPMTTSPGAADHLVAHAEINGTPGMVGHIQLHNLKFKELCSRFKGKQVVFAQLVDGNAGPYRRDVSA